MSLFTAVLTTVALLAPSVQGSENAGQSAQQPQPPAQPPRTSGPSGELQQRIAPGLATLTDDVLFGDVWSRPELSPRDRSLVTISVLIATGKPAQLSGHLGRALGNGVQPIEASGVLAHLAIYCGWRPRCRRSRSTTRCTPLGGSTRRHCAPSARGLRLQHQTLPARER